MEVGRVQAIAFGSISKDIIPSEFVRPENEQPGITTVRGPDFEVPVIDIGNTDEEMLVELISRASSDTGMFQIINHGVPNDAIRTLQKAGKEFFELPREEKEKYSKLPGSVEGYGTSLQIEKEGKEQNKGWGDHLFHNIWPPSAINYRFWPKNPTSYRKANEEYAKYLKEAADKLFKCLSLGLGLERSELKDAVGGDEKMEYLLKINYYPPCPRPDLALGVAAHTDMSALTILVPNEVQGLQICRDDRWYNVKYIPNALIIHIGDQIEIMSNGKYKAVLHRTTVTKDKTRMSWPVFLQPPKELTIGPIPKLVSHDNPAKYKTKKYGDFVYCKLNRIPQ